MVNERVLKLVEKATERDPDVHVLFIFFLTTTDMDSKMFAFEVIGCLQCISMVLLHMLVQV